MIASHPPPSSDMQPTPQALDIRVPAAFDFVAKRGCGGKDSSGRVTGIGELTDLATTFSCSLLRSCNAVWYSCSL